MNEIKVSKVHSVRPIDPDNIEWEIVLDEGKFVVDTTYKALPPEHSVIAYTSYYNHLHWTLLN